MSASAHAIAFCSPAGGTRRAAEAVAQRLQEQGCGVDLIDLTEDGWRNRAERVLSNQAAPACVWVGSPVYAQHPVPPVHEFFSALPEAKGTVAAVPFVTFGAVSSGVALQEMGQWLESKGYRLAGAARIVSEHSSMWRCEHPLGQGRPGAEDLDLLRRLADLVVDRIGRSNWEPVPLDRLDYQPEWIKQEAAAISIDKVKGFHPGYGLIEERCTQCGICEQECPAGAITLDPYPQRGPECFLCNNCARLCPEGAITIDTAPLEQRIREMAEKSPEPKETEIFQ